MHVYFSAKALWAERLDSRDVDLKKYHDQPQDLTHCITRTHSFPNSYGGFSDVWRCKLDSFPRNGIKVCWLICLLSKDWLDPTRCPREMSQLRLSECYQETQKTWKNWSRSVLIQSTLVAPNMTLSRNCVRKSLFGKSWNTRIYCLCMALRTISVLSQR